MLLLNLMMVEGKRKNKSKMKNNRFPRFFLIMLIIATLLFGPAIFSFCMALYRDPAVPKLFRVTVDTIRKRGFSYLGRTTPEDEADEDPASAGARLGEPRQRRKKSNKQA